MPSLSDIFVTVRADASQMGRDLESAHNKGILSAERMEHHFMSKMGRMLGVWEAMKLGATSLGGAMKQIEAYDLIDPGKGKESLQALLAIHEAERDIIREIPLIGGLGAALLAAASGDKNIKKDIATLGEISGGQEALSYATSKREAMQLRALQASGAPAEQVASVAAEQLDRKLQNERSSELEKADKANELAKAQFARAARLRASPQAQYAEKYGSSGLAPYLMRAINPVVTWQGNRRLTEADALAASGTEANLQYVMHRRAAAELGKTRELAQIANSGMMTAGGATLPGAIPTSAQTEYLLGQILERLNAGVRLTP